MVLSNKISCNDHTITSAPPVSQRRVPTPKHSYNPRPRLRSCLTELESNLCNHIYDKQAVKKLTFKELREHNQEILDPSMSNELGLLAQCNQNNVKGADIINFISKQQIPVEATFTYARIVPNYRPLKDSPYRMQLTVGGDRLPYNDITKTDYVSLPTIKIHFSSTISTPGAKYMTADAKKIYLLANNQLKKPEFMRIHISDIPIDIIKQCHLTKIVNKSGFVYIAIDKGMYGLKHRPYSTL